MFFGQNKLYGASAPEPTRKKIPDEAIKELFALLGARSVTEDQIRESYSKDFRFYSK